MALTRPTGALAALAGLETMAPEAADLWATAGDANFPGAVLPVRRDGSIIVYAVAETGVEWRKLQPLLLAFVGPTFTDFEGAPSALDLADPFEAGLQSEGVYAVARLRPGPFAGSSTVVVRALARLHDRLREAPDLTEARPEPTSKLLARLQDALNAGAQDDAWSALGVLRQELRLDALNLVQLEMQILASMRQWGEIRYHDRFETLVFGGPTPATAEILLEAIYHIHIASLAEDAARSAVQTVLRVPIEALLRRLTAPNLARVVQFKSLLAPISDAVAERAEPARVGSSSQPTDLLAFAQAALYAAGPIATAETDLAAFEALAGLSAPQTARLLSAPVFVVMYNELQARIGNAVPPRSWESWIDRLGDPHFDAVGYAAEAPTEWRLGDEELDPLVAEALAADLLAIPEGLAASRLENCLPYMAAWAKKDMRWPRRSLVVVYLAILTRMALGAARGSEILNSAAVLVDSCLQAGVTKAEYREVLDAAREIARVGLSHNSAYEVLEIVEAARQFDGIDPVARAEFTLSSITDLMALRSRLTLGQRVALAGLAREVGWEDQSQDSLPDETGTLSSLLSTVEIAIYTLTEGAGRAAQESLSKAAPGIRVELNHGHGGSSALAALAIRADVFIIAWSSAAHAATDFIREKRGKKPIVYAAGKGASSIVRAVEEWAVAQT